MVKAVPAQRNDAFDVNIQPDVSALRMFRSMSFTPWYALGEFVDNSITSAMKNQDALIAKNGPDYQLRIQIDFPPDSDELIIRDNASGINRADMQRALRMGKAPQDISIGLSRHGVGMKAAAFWWGSRLEIRTYPIDEPHGWHALIDVSGEGEVQASVRVTAIPGRGFPGTEVRISNLWQKTPRSRTKGAIREYLPSIYRAFLGGGTGATDLRCILEYEGEQLLYVNEPLLHAPFWPSKDGPEKGAEPMTWRSEFSTTLSSGKHIFGWYGIFERLSRNKSGFFLHYRGKGIAGVVPVLPADNGKGGHESEGAKDAIARASYKPRKIFGSPGSHLDQSWVGEFDVSDFGKTISTDSPLWSSEEESEFIDALHKHMKQNPQPERNFFKMAGQYARRKVTREVERELFESQQRESKRIESAMNDTVSHVDVSTLPLATYKVPPVVLVEDPEVEDESDKPQKVSFRDRDGHEHTFTRQFIADRSADFISVFESAGSFNHVVQVNRLHPILDDIPGDVRTIALMTRIAFALAAAEVFLTLLQKQLVREKMNEYLQVIAPKSIDG
jgi:hypothetical protein